MYDRYTNEWGLNNLIWNLGYSGDVKGGWYPGDEYVDIIGADTYVNHTDSLVSMYQRAAGVSSKPVCLHENGPIPDPEKMKADGAKWLWFMTWHTSFIDSNAINTAGYLKQVYNSDYMLTLDEIPDVYSYGVTSIEPQQGEEEQDDTPVLIGDVNVDGVIDKADVTLLIKYLMTSAELTEQQAVRADFNEDGKINAADLTLLKRQFVGSSKQEQNPEEEHHTNYQFDPAKTYTTYPTSYANAIPQAGTVVKETYNGINGTNSLNVYLPYGYDAAKKYNVFYFMHGMGDNEDTLFYNNNGEMQRVLDNMIRNGDIEPMIVVTPTFNKCSAETFYGELRESVIPFIEGKYATYANSNSPADIAASRMHRAYGGFSMGSVSTWAVFQNCLDIIGYYLPMSGDHWGGCNSAYEKAAAMAQAVDRSGLQTNQYFIFSATGTSDMAYPNLGPQVEEMKKMPQFVNTSDFSKGNFWFLLSNGGEHNWYYVRQYLYNGLPFFFR